MMITLKEWLETVEYKITEGSDFTWSCYGSHAHTLDSWSGDNDGHSFTVIFDTKTQVVYEVQAHDYKNDRAYRIINPDFLVDYEVESEERGCSVNEAWDDVNYVDLETKEDWIEKATAIREGRDYDTRVSIPVDFTDEELLKYMKIAHERDMTFNQLIEEALREAIEEHKRDPEGMKARAQKWKEEHQ
jgi:hypothetical protein